MQTTTILPHNVCVRCGKPRITAKTWKEKIGNLITTFSLTVCPDADCQAVVDRDNAKQQAKRAQEKELREQRKQQNSLLNANRTKSKKN